jgi:hypothetical protein
MRGVVAIGVATLTWAAPLSAQPATDVDRTADASGERAFEVELGGDFAFLTRNVRSEDGDDVASTKPIYRGLHVAPRYRADSHWAVGVVGASQWNPEVVHGTRSSMWHLLGEARYNAVPGFMSPWLGVLVGASNRVVSPEGETGYVHSAASFGVDFGLDIAVSDRVALAVIARDLYTAFGDADDGRGFWVWLGLGVQLRPVRLLSTRTASR